MEAFVNKEGLEAIDELIADLKRKREERLQRFYEKHKPYESLDDILIRRCGLTQEQIDHYQFRIKPSDRREYDAMIQRFLSEDIP